MQTEDRSAPASSGVSTRGDTLAASGLAAWTAFRIPAALLLLFVLREPITHALGDPAHLTLLVIQVLGTPVARAIIWVGFALALLGAIAVTVRFGEVRGYVLAMLAFVVLTVLLLRYTGTPLIYGLPALALAATNLLPDRLFNRVLPTTRLQSNFVTFAPGIAEGFFFRRYLARASELVLGRRIELGSAVLGAVPAALIASAALTALLKSHGVAGLEQAIRMPSEARVITHGDFNWIEFEPNGKQLYAGGHGFRQLLRYDVSSWAPPLTSPVDNGGAQGFAYDAASREIYVFNAETRQLLYLDADTLALKRSIPVPDLSPGDDWIAVDGPTNTLTLASEADFDVGVPFVVLDRTTGAVRDKRDLDPGNILLRPGTSRLYLSFFRRRNSLMLYDLRTLSIVGEELAPQKVDRMLLLDEDNEILLASPIDAKLYRFNASTLAPKGSIDAIFGARVMAMDKSRDLVLCASLVTGEVALIRFSDGQLVKRVYLGPWLRTIQVDEARGVAFVSSNGSLFELNYGNFR